MQEENKTTQQDNIEDKQAKRGLFTKSKILKILGYTILSIISLIIILAIFIRTEYGQHKIVNFINNNYAKTLSIREFKGNLFKHATIEDIHLKNDSINLSAKNISLSLDFAKLFLFKLSSPELNVDDLVIKIKTNPENVEESSFINKLLSIDLKKIINKNLYLSIDNYIVDLHGINSGFKFKNRFFEVERTSVRKGYLSIREPMKISKKLTDAVQTEQERNDSFLQIFKQSSLQELKEKLSLEFKIDDLLLKDFSFKTYNTSPLYIKLLQLINLKINQQGIALEYFKLNSDLGETKGNGLISLVDKKNSNFELTHFGKGKSINDSISKLLSEHQIKLKITGLPEEITSVKLELLKSSKQVLNGLINLSLNQPKLPLNGSLQSKNFSYTTFKQGEKLETINIKDANLKLTGNLLNYQVNGNIDLDGTSLPLIKNQISADGGVYSFHLKQLTSQFPEGNAKGDFFISWKNQIKWQHNIKILNFNTKPILKYWDTSLSGDLVGDGYFDNGSISLNYPNLNLLGKVNQQDFKLNGGLKYLLKNDENNLDNMVVDTNNLNLNYGTNQLSLNGLLSTKQTSNIDLKIDANKINGIFPGLSGQLKGFASVQGNLKQGLKINSDLHANNFAYNQLKFTKLDSKIDLNNLWTLSGNLDVNLSNLEFNDNKYGNLKAILTPDGQSHLIKLKADAIDHNLDVILKGKFIKDKVWQGNLNEGKLSYQQADFKLDKITPVKVDFNNQQINVGQHCWRGNMANICAQKDLKLWKNNDVAFNVQNVQLDFFNKKLKEFGVDVQGKLNSDVEIVTTKNKQKDTQIKIKLSGDNIGINKKLSNRVAKFKLQNINIESTLNQQEVKIDSKLNFSEGQNINTNILIKDPINEKKLSGTIVSQGLNVDIFKDFLPPKDQIDGNIKTNLTLSGNLLKPLLNGNLTVSNLKYDSKSLPIEINNSDINVAFKGNYSNLTANIKNEYNENLLITGKASWDNLENINTDLQLTSEQITVKYLNMVSMKLKPNIKLSLDKHRIDLDGNVDLIDSSIYLKEMPENAVTISDDEVILNKQNKFNHLQKDLENRNFYVDSNVKIRIIDKMLVDAYGFKTALLGDLTVKQEKSKLGLFGELKIAKGEYRAYGKDLIINKGTISFVGSPSNPVLNIEAIRAPSDISDNVVAGVRVTGLGKKPKLEIFTIPAKSQEEALSYFLTGTGLEEGGGSQLGVLMMMAGAHQSSSLVGDIGEKFGISNLSFSSENSGEKTEVSLSGDLSKKIRLKYSVGIFDGLSKFAIRYKIMTNFYVQATKSLSNYVDFIYQFEF